MGRDLIYNIVQVARILLSRVSSNVNSVGFTIESDVAALEEQQLVACEEATSCLYILVPKWPTHTVAFN